MTMTIAMTVTMTMKMIMTMRIKKRNIQFRTLTSQINKKRFFY